MVLPVILFIIDYFMLKRPVPKFWMLLSLVLSFVIMAVTKNAQPDSAVASGIIVWYQRPFIIMDSLSFYFTKLLFPLGLTSLYGRTPAVALGSHAAFYFIWVLFTFFYLLRRQRWTRTVGIAFLLAGVALLPTSGVIPFLFQKYSTVADRFAYLALFGVAWGVANLYAKYPRIRFATLVIISALSYISQKQLKAWEGDTTVLGHMAKVAPTADHRYNLAMLLSSQLIGKNLIPGLAIRQLPPPKNEEQARVWMKVIELNFREAVRLRPHFPEAWYGLSGVLVQEGKIAPAIAAANTAIEQDPDSEQAWQRLSLLWEWGGRKDLANAVWERWVERLAVKRTLG